MAKPSDGSAQPIWYTCAGSDQDVVVSTKATLSRNLANFPFPSKLDDSESDRIQSIVFDAFNYLPDAGDYQISPMNQMDEMSTKILTERDVLFPHEGRREGLIMRNDSKVTCTVNTDDHIKLSAFSPGLGVDVASNLVYQIDKELQKRIQFAASHDFGYLNHSVLDSGTGLSFRVKVHLPGLSLLKSINNVSTTVAKSGFNFSDCFGAGGGEGVSGFGGTGASLGSYYCISTKSSGAGSELDQMTAMLCTIQNLVKEERAARITCAHQYSATLANCAVRCLALSTNSLFMTLRESIEIISGIKFAASFKFIVGIDDTELNALLYKVQEGHLDFVLKELNFKFDKEIQDSYQKRIERARALVIHDAFKESKN